MPDRSTFVTFPEKYIYSYVDLWKPWDVTSIFNAEGVRILISDRIHVLNVDDRSLGIRPDYFDDSIILNLLNCDTNLYSYFESQILFIIAKFSLLKKKDKYSLDLLSKDIDDFFQQTKDSVLTKFRYTVSWFSLYSENSVEFVRQIESIILNRYEEIATIISSYTSFDYLDDLVLFLNSSNFSENSLNYIYATALGSDPFLSDDEALVFKAEEIINDENFTAYNKNFTSYAVMNCLKQPTNFSVSSFYNFYSSDESTPGRGDKLVDSSTYYIASSGFKSMPRYMKLTWSPIIGGAGIDTRIVPVSGNITDISELQISNELYFSQEFRKDSKTFSILPHSVSFSPSISPTISMRPVSFSPFISGSSSVSTRTTTEVSKPTFNNYITICSSSDDKFSRSKFWSKIVKSLAYRETKDLIDNKMFVTNHSLLRKRSEEEPRLQYVGYLITKYEFRENKWYLKEVVTLDDCASSTYYDFNVLYNRRYKYKISSLIKWVYSTSLTEVEAFYSDAPSSPEMPPPDSLTPEVPIVETPDIEETISIRPAGELIMGSDVMFEHRHEALIGETDREDEHIRFESRDELEATKIFTGLSISETLKERTRMSR